VVGVDISPEMIRLAREKNSHPHVTYVEGDAAVLRDTFKSDLVTASFFLCYASFRRELEEMCYSIERNLNRGGRFCGIVPHPLFPEYDYPQYGISSRLLGATTDGVEQLTTFSPGTKKSFSVANYHWTAETTEDALKKAGLKDIKWCNVIPSQKAIQEHGLEFWLHHLKRPPAIMIEARK